MAPNEMLLKSANRLGIQDSDLIKKAESFHRVLSTKPISKTLSDIAKTVLCLDLAASNLGAPFDKSTALQLTTLKKTNYQNSLNNAEKALDLDKPLSVSELSVQLGYSEVKDLADTIFNEYKNNDLKIKDIDHPQYVAAAVFTACKIRKIKVEKQRFVEISRLKPSKWNELIDEFIKFAHSLNLGKPSRGRPPKNVDFAENVETSSFKQRKRDEEEHIEDYETWKERIISEANAQIKQQTKKV